MDSAADICGAQRDVLKAAGYAGDLSDEVLRRFIGHHLIDLFGHLGFPDEQHDAMVQHYRSIYLGRGHRATRVYPGVAEMLAGLDGLSDSLPNEMRCEPDWAPPRVRRALVLRSLLSQLLLPAQRHLQFQQVHEGFL